MDPSGSSALVVGGAGGFGSATVRRLAQAGARVVIADMADDKGEALAKELDGRAVYVHTDVTARNRWTWRWPPPRNWARCAPPARQARKSARNRDSTPSGPAAASSGKLSITASVAVMVLWREHMITRRPHSRTATRRTTLAKPLTRNLRG